jgi:outer membrane usher protein
MALETQPVLANKESWLMSPLQLKTDRSLRSLAVSATASASQPHPVAAAAPPSAPLPKQGQSPARSPTRNNAKTTSEVLLLDVRVNSQRLSEVVRVEQMPTGRLLVSADAWQEARLALGEAHTMSDGTPAYALDTLPGATYNIDRQNLSLEINAPATAFIGSSLGGLQGQDTAAPSRPNPGIFLNYDASLQRAAGGELTGGATLEAIAFSKLGNLVSSVLVRADGNKQRVDRLDTFWRYDMPDRMETIVVGDAVGVGGGWSRPARYGGFRYGRDFGYRPGFVTLPQLSLNGSATLPSTVDLMVNNVQRLSQPVQPGPFTLNNVPLVTGAGEVNLVVRDLLGRETVVVQNYYAAPRLLAPGLTDFSIEGGKLRTGSGQDSQYGSAFGAVTWRQGLTSSLTGEGRVEVQADRQAAGLELAGLLGTWGVGRMALAMSTGNLASGTHEQGQLLQLSIERNTPSGGGTLQYERASQGFEPFGAIKGGTDTTLRSRDRLLAAVGGNFWRSFSGAVSYISQSQWSGDSIRSMSLSVSTPLWHRAGLSLSMNKRIDGDRAMRASLVVSMPLDNGIYTSARLTTSSGDKPVGVVSAARNAPAGPGVGWRVEGSSEQSQLARVGLQYNTSHAEFAADAASGANGKVELRGGARGTLGLLAGLPFASRPVGQSSFAVVEVDGLAGVPVKRGNQVVAETDARGRAFIPGLLPWQINKIEIDPVELPLDTEVGATIQQVTPYARSGSVVKFAVRRTRQALLVLHQPNGVAVPPGTRVTLLPGGAEFLAGRRGEVWLSDLGTGQQQLRVDWPGGGCELDLPVLADSQTPPKIGPIACSRN